MCFQPGPASFAGLAGRLSVFLFNFSALFALLRGYHLGVNAYLVKPVNFQELPEAVKRVGVFWGLVEEPPAGSVPRKS